MTGAVHGARRVVARWLAAVRLHRITSDTGLPPGWIRKCRVPAAEWLILPGNLFLRLQGVSVEVLPLSRWLAWETLVAGRLGRGIRNSPNGRGLEFPVLRGRTLDAVLRSDALIDDKLQAIYWASVALSRLHEIFISGGDVADWALSHGDATCRNVMINSAENSAAWFDFDTRHRRSMSAPSRQADDLRALLCSSAELLKLADYEACVDRVFQGFVNHTVVREVRRSLAVQQTLSVFHLAQAPLTYRQWQHLRHVVSQNSRSL